MTKYLQQKTLFGPQIAQRPAIDLGLVVVIPCHDEKYVIESLSSLKKCSLPPCSVEVIVVVNHGENAPSKIIETNQNTYRQLLDWCTSNSTPRLKFFPLYHDSLPKKHAGVGLARKIGMDEATWRLEKSNNSKGIIACFDADSKAQKNYLSAIFQHFLKLPNTQACSIHYEHPLQGIEHPPDVYKAIIQYELHLRYYIQAQRYAGFPFAYQTIGSSMAVRADAYQLQGGMNKRKAGEDFYFLHKFIESGYFSELTDTTVIPSPRPSDRVPFGTGKAVNTHLQTKEDLTTYAIDSFDDLKIFFAKYDLFYKQPFGELLTQIPDSVRAFLQSINAEKNWLELHQNTSDLNSFKKRFFRWFNAFMLMKYVHYSRDHFYPDMPVLDASIALIKRLDLSLPRGTHREHLIFWRELDKKPKNNLSKTPNTFPSK